MPSCQHYSPFPYFCQPLLINLSDKTPSFFWAISVLPKNAVCVPSATPRHSTDTRTLCRRGDISSPSRPPPSRGRAKPYCLCSTFALCHPWSTPRLGSRKPRLPTPIYKNPTGFFAHHHCSCRFAYSQSSLIPKGRYCTNICFRCCVDKGSKEGCEPFLPPFSKHGQNPFSRQGASGCVFGSLVEPRLYVRQAENLHRQACPLDCFASPPRISFRRTCSTFVVFDVCRLSS